MESFQLRLNDDGTSATLYLQGAKDKTFVDTLRALPQVAVVKRGGGHVKLLIELNPLFTEEELRTAIAPLADALVKRQTPPQPYTPNFTISKFTMGGGTLITLTLQKPADDKLLAELTADPGVGQPANYPNGFQVTADWNSGYHWNEVMARIETYAHQFMARQA